MSGESKRTRDESGSLMMAEGEALAPEDLLMEQGGVGSAVDAAKSEVELAEQANPLAMSDDSAGGRLDDEVGTDPASPLIGGQMSRQTTSGTVFGGRGKQRTNTKSVSMTTTSGDDRPPVTISETSVLLVGATVLLAVTIASVIAYYMGGGASETTRFAEMERNIDILTKAHEATRLSVAALSDAVYGLASEAGTSEAADRALELATSLRIAARLPPFTYADIDVGAACCGDEFAECAGNQSECVAACEASTYDDGISLRRLHAVPTFNLWCLDGVVDHSPPPPQPLPPPAIAEGEGDSSEG